MVIFEELKPYHLPAVLLLRLLGYQPSYMRLNHRWRQRRLLWWLLARLPVAQLSSEPLVYLRANPAGDIAFDIVGSIYEKYFFNNPYVRRLVKFFDSEDLHLAFKKSLLLELETFYYYELLFARVASFLAEDRQAFLVAANATVVGMHRRSLPLVLRADPSFRRASTVEFHIWSQVADRLLGLNRIVLFLGYWLYLLARSRVARSQIPDLPREVEFAFTIVSPLREFVNDVAGVGFMLDGQRLRKDNSIFIALSSLSAVNVSLLRQRGFWFVTKKQLRHWTNVSAASGMTKDLMSLALKAPLWLFVTAVFVLKERGMWAGFLRRYKIRHFVTYSEFGGYHVARNLTLRREGVRTWYYMDTSNHYHAFCGGEKPPHRVAFWGFLLYDNYVLWNRINSTYMRRHHQKIGRYVEIGVLWSELIGDLLEGKLCSEEFEALKSRVKRVVQKSQKIVAVFDSTYNNETITGFVQGVAFARDVYRLLGEYEDILVIFKEKKEPQIYSQLGWDTMGVEDVYRKLAQHPRCLMLGYQSSQAAVIALSDLTISFPFTSTTLEAIGVRRKAIYYDPLGSYGDTFYDKIPGFVLHDFDSLKRRVRELLYETDSKAYHAYLVRYALRNIDPFLDGHALTRFRNLLCEETYP